MDGHVLTLDNAAKFVLAGDAVFTIHNTITDVRMTYRVQRAKGDDAGRPWFVKVLTGPNNMQDYSYLGTIFITDEGGIIYRHGKKSHILDTAPSAKGIAWFVRNIDDLIVAKRELAKAELFGNPAAEAKIAKIEESMNRLDYYHEGRCGRCARRLTVPTSITVGLGPECVEAMGLGPLDLIARAI